MYRQKAPPGKELTMRRLLPLLLGGLAACVTPRASIQDHHYDAEWHDVPLQASLWIDQFTGVNSFQLSKPAHAALFVWHPGSHFHMVYPAVGYDTRQYFGAGVNQVADAHRMLDPGNRTTASPRYATYQSLGFASDRVGFGPTYAVLVVSEEPLDVASFYNRAAWISRANWSGNLFTATELLASQVVPNPAASEWTVAYQVIWPEHFDTSRSAYGWVRCPGGITIALPLDMLWVDAYCPDGSRMEPPDRTAPGPDSASVRDRSTPLNTTVAAGEERSAGQAMYAYRPAGEELRELVRGMKELRGQDPDRAEARSLPTWRPAGTSPAADRMTATADRPVVLPGPGERSAPTVRPGARTERRPAAMPPAARLPEARPPANTPQKRPPPPPVRKPDPKRPPPSSATPPTRPPPDPGRH
jgi:hypothetical protein